MAQAMPAMMPAARPSLARVPVPPSRPLPQTTALQPGARPQAQPIPQQRPIEQRYAEQQVEAPRAYEADLDEAPLPPRQIPAHLQQPLRPQPAPRAGARATESRFAQPKPGLFNEAPRSEAPPPPRKSLFGIVTGAIRGHSHAEAAPAQPPSTQAPAAPAAAPQEPSFEPSPIEARDRSPSRAAGGEEMGIEIPAFLRRQS
jgi:cell division protein FtsZ